MARELVTLAASDAAIYQWIEQSLTSIAPSLRRERIFRCLGNAEPIAAAQNLSPSDLLALGTAYLTSLRLGSVPGESAPSLTSPVLDRLRQIPPEPDSPDAVRFRDEIAQYGVSLRLRLGMTHHSLSFLDSYEMIEAHSPRGFLYERMCDLKVRLAEICYSMGLPAYLGGILGEQALRHIYPESSRRKMPAWDTVLEDIDRITPRHAGEWLEKLIDLGILTIYSQRAGGR
jgi:hypothetical protein